MNEIVGTALTVQLAHTLKSLNTLGYSRLLG